MKVNHTKTNFFVINGGEKEKESLCVDDLVVEWCDKYVYLGSPFTADGSVLSVISAHATAKIRTFLNLFPSKRKIMTFLSL